MSANGFVEFLRGMGHRVRQVGDTWWYNVHPHIYMSFPFHRPLDPFSFSLKEVLGRDGLVARYLTPLDMGRASYRLVCDRRDYDWACLSTKARNQTRRGLENCIVRRISFDELQVDGVRLNRETLERQGRAVPVNFEAFWKKYFIKAGRAEGAEAWGSLVNGDLAAYLIAFDLDDCSNIFIVRSATKYLKLYPNNALFFSVIQQTMKKPEIREISIGLESVQHSLESLDHFKIGMGFHKIPAGQRIELAPWLSPFLRGPILRAIQHFLSHRQTESCQKMIGMLEWYQEQPKLSAISRNSTS